MSRASHTPRTTPVDDSPEDVVDDRPWYLSVLDDSDEDDEFEILQDTLAESEQRTRSRGRAGRTAAPRVVVEGQSTRTVEVDGHDPERQDVALSPYSSYDVASHGPDPVPDWLVTDLSARDTDLGVLKTGKEADVHLLDRSLDHGPGCLLAVKTYRSSHHRQFHRDSSYQEGRRTRRSREMRAMAARTSFGRDLLSGKWAGAEFDALTRLWDAGAPVPYPVQLIGSELMMEFIGTPDGAAAPRLAEIDAGVEELTELWHELVGTLELLAEHGWAHGDLSPYNVLVRDSRCILIDLPQVVDVVANPQGRTFLRRDASVIAGHFARHGVLGADADLLTLRLENLIHG